MEKLKPITPKELDTTLADQPYDLSGRLLVGAQLRDSDLEGVNFRGTVLRGCTISHCKLDNSDFTGADLGDTAFIRCKMEYCKFDGAAQEHAIFDRCARFGSTGIGGDTRTHSEVVFDDMMGMVRGVDLDLVGGWRQFIFEHAGPDGDAYGNMLWELQEKFDEIDRAYPGMGAEIFNSGAYFLPHELRGAANYIAHGSTVGAARQLAERKAFTGEEPMPEQAMLVLPHSETQKNYVAERAFSARMQRIKGLNYFFSGSWIRAAWDVAKDQAGALGVPRDELHRQVLREYGDALEQVKRQYGRAILKEIFERDPDLLPGEVLPAAAVMHNGGTFDQAYAMALEHKLAPEPCAAVQAYEYIAYAAGRIAWLAGDGDVCYSFEELRAEYHLNPGQMPLLTELLGARVDLKTDGPAGTFTMRPKPEPAQREASEPMDQADLDITHALHTLWAHGQPGGERADFSEAELTGLDFSGMRFPGVSFAGTALDGCCFQLADLMGAGFAYAALTDCDFRFTDTEGVDFSQAEIANCAGLEEISSGMTMKMQ